MTGHQTEPPTSGGDPSGDPSGEQPGEWYDPSRETLQVIAEGVTQLAGFGVAAISVARDDGKLEVMAVAGSDAAREQLTGTRTPIDRLQAEIAKADEWGLLRFVPHDRLDEEVGEAWGWVPDYAPSDDPDAWHPLDLLIAPLHDEHDVLRGTLSIDLPVDGRRPGPAQRQLLQRYAEQAGRAVITVLEREALAHRVRLADAARDVVRRASAQLSLTAIVRDVQAALVEGFGARSMWLRTLDGAVAGGTDDGTDGAAPPLPLGAEIREGAAVAARTLWEAQRVQIVERGRPFEAGIDAEHGAAVLDYLDRAGIGSLLFVPLGAGPECLGVLVLTREPGDPDWTGVECAAALDIGRDLGRAILNARTFEREHQLVQELQELDLYKSQLIATVSHELKNPLTAIIGHLEMLDSTLVGDAAARSSLTVMERAAQRLLRVVDDLLLLSKVGDPDNPVIPVPVDLRRVLEEVTELGGVEAARKHLELTVEAPEEPLPALGDHDELHRVCANLVSNAVKYTPEGGHVRVGLHRHGDEVVLEVADDGIGISAADRERLFSEFFRGSDPAALAQPGTGLGLAIVQRIVTRHRGRVEVDSEPGRGSTFRVVLPAARPEAGPSAPSAPSPTSPSRPA